MGEKIVQKVPGENPKMGEKRSKIASKGYIMASHGISPLPVWIPQFPVGGWCNLAI